MRKFGAKLLEVLRKGDMVLLALCVLTSVFGIVMVAASTAYDGSSRYVIIQTGALITGILLYLALTAFDIDILAGQRTLLFLFNTAFLAMLLVWGVEGTSGNKSWLHFPFLPFNIQPAEVCKITYVVIMASVMSAHQNRISSLPSIMHMCLHLGLLVGLNMVLSGDAGVSLIFVFIFIGMAFGGGVSLWWFVLAIGLIVAAFPILWQFLGEYQQNRFLILVDDTIDPMGINERYHSMMNLRSLTGGGLTGQGLFNGNRTQSGSLFAGHTDYIFSSMGEELGFVGCLAIMIMEMAIIARCIYVGIHCQDYMRRLVCYGAASALMFQVMINTGMCIGVMPVIGLTLPLISYGGSSVVTIYAMLGLVSGAHARPQSLSHERYVQPYR